MATATGKDAAFEQYKARLTEFVRNAQAAKSLELGFPAGKLVGLRRLATSSGAREGQFNTLRNWVDGSLKEEIRPESYSLLAAIDPEGRNPLEIQALLKGVEPEELSAESMQAQVLALHKEVATLKKQRAGMLLAAIA